VETYHKKSGIPLVVNTLPAFSSVFVIAIFVVPQCPWLNIHFFTALMRDAVPAIIMQTRWSVLADDLIP
jgi:hypothetical protein